MRKAIYKPQANCAFFDNEINLCRLMSEKICTKRKCIFFITRENYEKGLDTNYLYNSYKKGAIDFARYSYLAEHYHK